MFTSSTVTTLYPNTHDKESGYILIIYSCVISFALILFAGAYMSFQENQIRMLEREISSIKAFYIAQAGLKEMAKPENVGNTELKDPNFGGGSYTVNKIGDAPPIFWSVGKYNGVTRTLQANINAIESPFKGAVYVHNLFSLANVGGTIDGKKSYALQCGEAILAAQCNIYHIYFKNDFTNDPDPNKPPTVIQRQTRNDYASLWSDLRNEVNDLCYINNNDNKKIIDPLTHDSSHSNQELPINGVATYKYNISAGKILSAYLTINTRKTYTLQTGNYYLNDLILEQRSTLNVNGPVTIMCTGELRLEDGAKINENGNVTEFSWRGYNKYTYRTPLPKIELFSTSKFHGTILAPYWHFGIRDGAELTGAVLVHSFGLYKGSTTAPWEITYGDTSQDSVSVSAWREIQSDE